MAERQHLLRGISVSRNAPPASHLFFVDDSLLFPEVSSVACQQVSLVLDQFSKISSQLMNYQKSFVKFSPNTPDNYRNFLFSSLRLGHRTHLNDQLLMSWLTRLPVEFLTSPRSGSLQQLSWL